MGRKPKILKIREDYRPLLIKTKKLFPTVLSHVKTKRIALAGLYARRSGHMARIHGNRKPWSLLIKHYDYIIEFWSTRFDDKPFSYRMFVMLHELVHIPPDGQIKGSPGYRRCMKHDVNDFGFLREAYGIQLENVKDVLKGEKGLLKEGPQRFPREENIH